MLKLTRDKFPFQSSDKFYKYLCKIKKRMLNYIDWVDKIYTTLQKYINDNSDKNKEIVYKMRLFKENKIPLVPTKYAKYIYSKDNEEFVELI